MVFYLAAGGAETANTRGDLEGPGPAAKLERLAQQGTGRAGTDTVTAEIAVKRFAVRRINQGSVAPGLDLDCIGPHYLVADLGALFA